MTQSETTEAAIRESIERYRGLQAENEGLKGMVQALSQERDRHLIRLDQLQSSVIMSATERDYYMRFSTELITRLSAISALVADTIRESNEKALFPGKGNPALTNGSLNELAHLLDKPGARVTEDDRE